MIRILRPGRHATLISAEVFNTYLVQSLHPEISVDVVPMDAWLDRIIGPRGTVVDLPEASRQFAAATKGHEFLCPDHHAIPLSPVLLALRNRSRAPIRLLLIAHAPGIYGLEWALLRPLLATGDRIIAPSESAREVIHFLCPELDRFVRVVPHPIPPLPAHPSAKPARIVSLSRLHRTKLVHRQIEAYAILARRRSSLPQMEIAGPVQTAGEVGLAPYARSLFAKIDRLALQDRVRLVGPVTGAASKASFLTGAAVLVNLSVSIEESFGKTIVEALGLGVPVIATEWNGFPEVLNGNGGRTVQVIEHPYGVDVDPECLAEAIANVLDAPPLAGECRARAAAFHPDQVRPTYVAILAEALDALAGTASEPHGAPNPGIAAAPGGGLLQHLAPLTQLAWDDLFELHVAAVNDIRSGEIAEPSRIPEAEQLRTLIIHGMRAPLERFLAGHPIGRLGTPIGQPPSSLEPPPQDSLGRLGAASQARGLPTSRLACLDALAKAGCTDLLQGGVERLTADGLNGPGVDYLRIEVARQRGDYARAFQLCVAPTDVDRWGEHAAPQVRQLAEVCRAWGVPGLALPWLRDWLDEFPDAPDAGLVWGDLALNASGMGPTFAEEAEQALTWAQALLGEGCPLDVMESSLAATA